MPTPEEQLAQLKAIEDQKAADAVAAEAKAKLEKEEAEKREAAIKAEAEAKVAEEAKVKAFNDAAKVEAEKLLKALQDKQAHDKEVERNVRKLRSAQRFGQGDPAKFQAAAELAKRGLAAIDPEGKMAAKIEEAGLGDDEDILASLIALGTATANDTFHITGNAPPDKKPPMTRKEKVVRWNGTGYD